MGGPKGSFLGFRYKGFYKDSIRVLSRVHSKPHKVGNLIKARLRLLGFHNSWAFTVDFDPKVPT